MHMVVSSGEGEISPQSLVVQYIFLFQNFMLVDNFSPLFFVCVCGVFYRFSSRKSSRNYYSRCFAKVWSVQWASLQGIYKMFCVGLIKIINVDPQAASEACKQEYSEGKINGPRQETWKRIKKGMFVYTSDEDYEAQCW